jgi:hypothetical protein
MIIYTICMPTTTFAHNYDDSGLIVVCFYFILFLPLLVYTVKIIYNIFASVSLSYSE